MASDADVRWILGRLARERGILDFEDRFKRVFQAELERRARAAIVAHLVEGVRSIGRSIQTQRKISKAVPVQQPPFKFYTSKGPTK